MSGPVANNVFRSSGVVASAAGGLSWQDVVTASTVTVEAGNGYPINTTSNTCTITLPSSAEAGDQIIFLDYARNWGTNKIIIDSNGLNYQGEDDTYTVEYDTDGQTVSIVYSGATVGWIPESDVDVTDAPVAGPTQKAIFAYGSGLTNVSNLVNSSGVVGTDVTGVGTARRFLAACGYGFDKAIFAYGYTTGNVSMSNLVTNAGVVGTDVSGVGTARNRLAAASYGLSGQGIFGYGETSGSNTLSITNLVSSAGVVATDTSGVGTARSQLAAATYGSTGQAIFGYGSPTGLDGSQVSTTNLVSSSGVVAADVSGVGTARRFLAAASYGGDKAIFGYGFTSGATDVSMTNLVNSSGVVASDVTGVGTARGGLAAASYGGDKALFSFGAPAVTNLVSSSGVVATDVTQVGTARDFIAGAGYSLSA